MDILGIRIYIYICMYIYTNIVCMSTGLGGWLLRLAAELAGPRGTPRELSSVRMGHKVYIFPILLGGAPRPRRYESLLEDQIEDQQVQDDSLRSVAYQPFL